MKASKLDTVECTVILGTWPMVCNGIDTLNAPVHKADQ